MAWPPSSTPSSDPVARGVDLDRASPKPALGILGGSFDPIHNGHLHLAEQARASVSLDKLILIPAATPPHKTGKSLTAARHRLAMIRLAIAGRDWIEVDESEIERGGISYTVDTVQDLASKYPGAALHFIIGSDSLRELHTWRDIKAIARTVTFITVRRDEAPPAPTCPELEKRLGGTPLENIVLEALPMPISSTEIRLCVAQGRPFDDHVHPAVVDYIAREGLYR